MSRKLLSSLTATLLITTLGAPPSGQAEQPGAVNQSSAANSSTASVESANAPLTQTPDSDQPTAQASNGIKLGEQASKTTVEPDSNQPFNQSHRQPKQLAQQSSDVVKLGEQQPQTASSADAEIIAKVHSHELNGQKAATLYVRNIPILTFVGSTRTDSETVKMGTQASEEATSIAGTKSLSGHREPSGAETETEETTDDPVWRATQIAARLNQLNRDGIDGNKITVSWDASNKSHLASERYTIKAGDTVLAQVDTNTMLPDSTRNLETDALQATNRLRRLLGNASPLSGVSGKPDRNQVISLGPIHFQVKGWASWYGPGFHGNPSASGEIFNQNALTAAHRTLPFGTRVLVTNLDNGHSVVVRIIDRGPFHGNRIIDLSAGAARVIGLMQSGVAPVRLDVLGDQQAAVPGN